MDKINPHNIGRLDTVAQDPSSTGTCNLPDHTPSPKWIPLYISKRVKNSPAFVNLFLYETTDGERLILKRIYYNPLAEDKSSCNIEEALDREVTELRRLKASIYSLLPDVVSAAYNKSDTAQTGSYIDIVFKLPSLDFSTLEEKLSVNQSSTTQKYE